MIINSNNNFKYSEKDSSFGDKNIVIKNFQDETNNQINEIKSDLANKKIDYTKILQDFDLSLNETDQNIFSKFKDLSPIEKIMMILEIRMEIERRMSKGITTPYYMDRQFTRQLKENYGIDIYGSSMMDAIMLISPKELGIIS